MQSKFFKTLLAVNPLIWLALFVVIQSFLYFQPYTHATSGAFFYLTVDPQLFPRDIIRTSSLGTSTLFYGLMHFLLGNNLTNLFYLFGPYLIVCSAIAWGMFLLSKLISGGKTSAAVLLFIMLLFEKQVIEGAYVSFTRTDFHYQHFTLPFLIFSIYFLLKERYLVFSLLLAFSFYFHLRSGAAMALAVLPCVLSAVIKKPKIMVQFIPAAVLLGCKVWQMLGQLHGNVFLSAGEKLDYLTVMLNREQMEGSMYFDAAGMMGLMAYILVAAVGIWCARFITDQKLRQKIYLCHAGVFFAFAVGAFARLKFLALPLGEIVMLGYSRASILGLLLTLITVSLCIDKTLEDSLNKKDPLKLLGSVFLVIFIGMNTFFATREFMPLIHTVINPKMIKNFMYSFVMAGLVLACVKSSGFKFSKQQTVNLLMIVVLAFAVMNGAKMVNHSAKLHYPYWPFVADPAFFIQDLEGAGAWTQNNTPKDTLFLVISGEGRQEADVCMGSSFRIKSLRSVWCQDPVGFYGNAEAFREWKRRRAVLAGYLGKPFAQWKSLLADEKIDYVLAPKDLAWPADFSVAYQNSQYIIYGTEQHRNN